MITNLIDKFDSQSIKFDVPYSKMKIYINLAFETPYTLPRFHISRRTVFKNSTQIGQRQWTLVYVVVDHWINFSAEQRRIMLSAARTNVWNLTWVGMIKISRIPIGKSLSFFKVFFSTVPRGRATSSTTKLPATFFSFETTPWNW